MPENPLKKLETFGQSIWLDYIRRHFIRTGELQRMIQEDGLMGITSNPSIFEKAIAESHDYDDVIQSAALEGTSAEDIYQNLVVTDIRDAADLLRPVYDRTQGRDGYVSLEVSPKLARDTDGSIQEARRLWHKVDKPNLMIKIPGTREGLPAIRQLIADGINVNVTLLFDPDRYHEVAEAYLAGLHERAAQSKPIDCIASVASFFLSRIDSMVDPLLEQIKGNNDQEVLAEKLHGQVAIHCAKTAYTIYQDIYGNDRFKQLAKKGAKTQRLLWASTSTKNPCYSDIKYVEALIGPDTVNTLPLETLHAYRDHGQPGNRLQENMATAQEELSKLSTLGIDLKAITRRLEEEGIEKFNQPFEHLMKTLEEKRNAFRKEPISGTDKQQFNLKTRDGILESAVQHRLDALDAMDFRARLWRKDASLWKQNPQEQTDIRNGLGWLHVSEKMETHLPDLQRFAQEVQAAGFRHVVHMGMGGSSLAPLVFQKIFPKKSGALSLTVLDTTDSDTIAGIEREHPLKETLFIVASKSGTTAEPLAFFRYFYDKVKALKGEQAGDHFVAITDPGTPLVTLAQNHRFRKVFLNLKDIGGRYSAMSYFGLLPAVLMGMDVEALIRQALCMAQACQSCVPLKENPGLMLGATLGELGRQERNKVTFILSPSIKPFGMWLEQLLAESTGKEGSGLLPVTGEHLGSPTVYGQDRFFAYLRLASDDNTQLDEGIERLKNAGHPTVTIHLKDHYSLGQEFLRWEIATATAGAILEIDAFNQPNVQESKENTNRLLSAYQTSGRLPEAESQASKQSFKDALGGLTGQAKPGDYISLMAYLTETPETEKLLETIRLELRDATRLATTVGYGPRFLHSTGQFHKGGPNTGLFIQLTAHAKHPLPIPGEPYNFDVFKTAQALGDYQALQQHERPVIRMDLGTDAVAGLKTLKTLVESALRVSR